MVSKKGVYAVLILAFIFVSLLILTYSKDCLNDESCFNKEKNKCSRASFTGFNNDSNKFLYEIRGKTAEECIISVTMLDYNGPANVKNQLDNKGMVCSFDQAFLKQNDIRKIENIHDYCSGPLKEAFLTIQIDQSYNDIISDLKEVLGEDFVEPKLK